APHARIDTGNIQRPGSFQRDLETGIAQSRQQIEATLLRERLAACDADAVRGMATHFVHDRIDVAPFAAFERVSSVAPRAAQRTPREAHEYRRPADRVSLALDGMEDFADAQSLRGGIRRRGRDRAHRVSRRAPESNAAGSAPAARRSCPDTS